MTYHVEIVDLASGDVLRFPTRNWLHADNLATRLADAFLKSDTDNVEIAIDDAPVAPTKTTGLTTGEAIEALKAGLRVQRESWNSKGMWLALTPGSEIPAGLARSGAAKAQVAAERVEAVRILPHIDMRAADGSLVIGWLASQTDLLAEDWQVLDEKKKAEPALPKELTDLLANAVEIKVANVAPDEIRCALSVDTLEMERAMLDIISRLGLAAR